MRIAFVLGAFPALSETFILNQITGLIDRGHTVDIYASGPRDDPKVHPDVERYALIGRTFYIKMPLVVRLREFVQQLRVAPRRTVGTAVLRRMGRRNLRTPSAGVSPLSSPPGDSYDVVHCHFGHMARIVDQGP